MSPPLSFFFALGEISPSNLKFKRGWKTIQSSLSLSEIQVPTWIFLSKKFSASFDDDDGLKSPHEFLKRFGERELSEAVKKAKEADLSLSSAEKKFSSLSQFWEREKEGIFDEWRDLPVKNPEDRSACFVDFVRARTRRSFLVLDLLFCMEEEGGDELREKFVSFLKERYGFDILSFKKKKEEFRKRIELLSKKKASQIREEQLLLEKKEKERKEKVMKVMTAIAEKVVKEEKEKAMTGVYSKEEIFAETKVKLLKNILILMRSEEYSSLLRFSDMEDLFFQVGQELHLDPWELFAGVGDTDESVERLLKKVENERRCRNEI